MIQHVPFFSSAGLYHNAPLPENIPGKYTCSAAGIESNDSSLQLPREKQKKIVLDEALTYETICLARSIIQLSIRQRGSFPPAILEFTVEQLKSIIQRAIRSCDDKAEEQLTTASQTDPASAHRQDEYLVRKVINLIEASIDDESLNVNTICKKLGRSRTNLYNKLKQLTGKSIGEFIRTIRLDKAAHLLAHENISVTEVMYQVGIRSQSYFTRFFKKEYGISPCQYAKLNNTALHEKKQTSSLLSYAELTA